MKTAEHTSTSQTLQKKTGSQDFFQTEGKESFFSEGSKGSAFFGGSSGGESPKPFFSPATVQAKLTIGQPGDKYEQEADAMADQVVQKLASGDTGTPVQRKCTECATEDQEEGIAPKLQRKSIFESNEEPVQKKVQRKCAACEANHIQPMRIQRMGGEEEELGLQAKSDLPSLQASSNLESRLNATKGSGSPLSEETQSSMGSAFGTDFSGVRVHTNFGAVQMNQELGAQAFTHGSDVYFNSGKYAPGSTEGQRLLGHELTHVVQQGGALKMKPSVQLAGENDVCTDGGSPGANSDGDMLYTEIDIGIYVVRVSDVESQLPTASSNGANELYPVEGEMTCHAFDRSALETSFANAGASGISDVYLVDPDNEGYLLLQSILFAQENRASEVEWDAIALILSEAGSPEQLATSATSLAQTVGPGPWNPPGGQPIPFYIGNSAHVAIALEYMAAHIGDEVVTNFTPISSILESFRRLGVTNNPGGADPGGLVLKPDIMNLSRRHLYEIKPANSASQAAAEAAMYIAVFASAGIVVTLGPTTEPGVTGIVPAPGGYFAFSSPQPGVIIYQYRRGPFVPVPVPETQPQEERPTERNWYEWEYWEEVTGLTGAALVTYLIISEGTRLIPVRNLIPVP